MEPLFYVREYQHLRCKLEPEFERLRESQENYGKLVRFLIVAEDNRFYNHPGYDIVGICRAIYKDVFKGKREGASTIEQQLVRVLTGDYRFSVRRKIKEIYLAAQLHRLADKYTLASAYLEFANYGTDLSGLTSVLNRFGVTLQQDIADEICAEIVARLKYPEPHRMTEKRQMQISVRKDYILRRYAEIFG